MSSRKDQLNFRFTVLTRPDAYWSLITTSPHVVPFPFYFLLKKFHRSRRPVSISHIPLSLSEHSIASKGQHHHLLSSAACPGLISTTASRLTPNGCVLGALQLRSSRVSCSTVPTRRCHTGETLIELKNVWNFRVGRMGPCAVARAALSASFLSCTSHMRLPSPSRSVRGCDCDTTESEQTRITPPIAVHSFTHSTARMLGVIRCRSTVAAQGVATGLMT